MKIELEHVLPADIERRSFAIISQELGPRTYGGPYEEGILKRVIHTSADFDYSENLKFSPGAVEKAMEAIRAGADIVTDTQMARAGINKASLARFGGQVHCFMADPDVAAEAKARGITRAAVCMEKAADLRKPGVLAVGNAPTALVRLYELMEEGRIAATVTQEPFAQGDEAVRVLFDYIHTGRRPAAGVVYTHNRVRVRHSQ